MSATSAPPPTDRDRTLERLIGVRSSKPSFYAAWRDNSERLDRSIETLERISTALCAAPEGPGALCDAVVEAAAHHFDAPWASMTFTGESEGQEPAHVIRRGHGAVVPRPGESQPVLELVASRALATEGPVMIDAADLGDGAYGLTDATGGVVAAPMPVQGQLVGVLAVGLPRDVVVQSTDLSILVTLANHAGVALHHAQLFAQSERVRRRLEEAGRRQLLSQERNRIARELHDSVAQHLLTIGMDLEWCRRHDSTSPPVLERVTTAKSLARSAVDEIRAVIFELASDGNLDLRRALREVIEDVVAGTRLQVGLRTYGSQQSLPGATQHALVQIAREALFNVVRHANAGHAWLTLRWAPTGVRLVVADDGGGDVGVVRRRLEACVPAGEHFGLAGIGGRVRELGGSAAVRRHRGGGVSLRVEVPLPGARDAG
ncbi:MAG TPA: histidine kinase [Solirubrobacteraceae bacterium]|jgi:signal transduction histidine kinase|nr:histidine kinase [Solirubrobacteraceae bacterium]